MFNYLFKSPFSKSPLKNTSSNWFSKLHCFNYLFKLPFVEVPFKITVVSHMFNLPSKIACSEVTFKKSLKETSSSYNLKLPVQVPF